MSDTVRSKRSLFAFAGLLTGLSLVLAIDPIAGRLRALEVTGGAQDTLSVSAAQVVLFPDDPSTDTVGALRFLGGLHLTSPDPRFGGLSGLTVSADGRRLIAVSDRGVWVELALSYKGTRLADASGILIAPMLDGTGLPLGDPNYDAESIAALKSGDLLVGFETNDRVGRYAYQRLGPKAAAEGVPMPADLQGAERNKGLEGLAMLDDDRLLAITERTLDDAGNMRGWIAPVGAATGGAVGAVTLKRDKPFELTDLARLANGDVLTLERRFSRLGGPGAQIRRIASASIVPGAVLDGPILAELDVTASIDNMEGLAVREGPDGETLLYILSDDNQSSAQRTLLLMFALVPG